MGKKRQSLSSAREKDGQAQTTTIKVVSFEKQNTKKSQDRLKDRPKDRSVLACD
jgi:hypothetical protein